MKALMTAALVSLGLMGPALAGSEDLLGKPWEDIVAQAKTEGEVTWFVWYQQPNFRDMLTAFTDETGIKVNIPEGDANGNKQKLLAEAGRETGDIDVIALGGDIYETLDEADLFLGPILSILPESANLTDQINGGNAHGYGVAFWGNQTGIAYDSRAVKPEDLPNSVGELSDWIAANPHRFGFNYENGGAGPSFAQNIARNVLELKPTDTLAELAPDMAPVWDWFNARKDSVTITASNADSITRINDGELLMAPAWEDHLAGLQREKTVGDFIEIYVPAWGMNGGGNMISVAKNAPHPAAALVLTAWLGSAKTQEMFNQRAGTAPTNTAANATNALIAADQRAYSTDWGVPLPIAIFVPAFIENVIQK